MGEVIGIKETKEAIDGFMQMSMVMALILKDGAQLSDIGQVFEKITSDAILRQKMQAALEGIGKVPGEITDISVAEGMELAMQVMAYIPQLIAILGKKSV